MRSLICSLILVASLSAESAPPIPQPSRDSDYDVLSVFVRNCAGCHQKEDHPGALFLNRARLSEKETKKLILELLETSQMPPEHKNFKATKDGKKLIKWLKGELAK